MSSGIIDNNFEWTLGSKTACVTFSQKKFINKLKKYAEKYPDDVDIVAEYDDCITAHVPASWFKFSPPVKREFTEEQRKAMAERMRGARDARDKSAE